MDATKNGKQPATTAPKDKTTEPNGSSSTDPVNDPPIGLRSFRVLLGIPVGAATDSAATPFEKPGSSGAILPAPVTSSAGDPASPPVPLTRSSTWDAAENVATIIKPTRYEWLWARYKFHRDPEYDSSMFIELCNEENKASVYYHLYDTLIYVSLFFQLVISAVLILLGALKGDHHISISVLGSINGVITGVLSLVRGQGLPERFINYKYQLRQVRENIEYTERELRTGKIEVKYSQANAMFIAYDKCLTDYQNNRPDVWTTVGSMKTPGTVKVQPSSGGKTTKHSKWKWFTTEDIELGQARRGAAHRD